MLERIESLKEEFAKLANWESRYKRIIEFGRELSGLNESDQVDKYKIKGCQSQVWFKPEFKEGKIYFAADSDSLLVKGIAAVLVNIYSGATPKEILENKDDFLSDIGISEHLSFNRTNGLASMVKQIHLYAIAYSHLQSR